MSIQDKIKLFAMSHQLLERELDGVEAKHQIELERDQSTTQDRDDEFYPQFDQIVRNEATEMASHYELFYCLERSIRTMITETLKAAHGINWWDKDEIVPQQVKDAVKQNMQNELDFALTPRSTEKLDYTTFGQLGEIVKKNWSYFGDTFNSLKGFTKVMTYLNLLRSPIAHCCPLAEDEVARLKITVRDWFRLMA